MSEDPFVRWRQSNPFGIHHSGSWKWHAEDEGPWSAWYSGRVKDTLALPDDSLLVAVESGGVWRTNADGTPAICVSNDWPAHRFNRLAQGPDGIDHAFAGGESLWVTDPKDPLPFLAWQQITSFTFGSVWDV